MTSTGALIYHSKSRVRTMRRRANRQAICEPGWVQAKGKNMEQGLDKFDLQSTVSTVWNAMGAVIAHILFDGAVHGLAMAALICTIGLVLKARGHRFGKPLLFVSRRIATVCVLLTIPGVLCIAFSGKLPDTGVYNINSLGFIVLWSMVSVHLCAEEMNFQWWIQGPTPKELGAEGKKQAAAKAESTVVQVATEDSVNVESSVKESVSKESSNRERVAEPR